MTVWLFRKQGVLDVVLGEDEVAIQSEEKLGVEVIQSGSPESPSAGHLNPIYFECRDCENQS
jgi:hypothetical protein